MFNWLSQKFQQRNVKVALAAVLLLVVVSILMPVKAEAFIIINLFGKLLQFIVYVLGYLAIALVWVLVKVAEYDNFINSEPVAFGWVIIRDICNMFFVIILLVIAIATILKIETYNYKKLLPKVIILAILINFSKTISGIAIDLAQIVMMTFVNGFKDIGPGNMMNFIGISELLTIDTSRSWWKWVFGDKDAVGMFFLAIIYLTIFIIVIYIMILVLIFRIVMLWFLVLLSPLFFVLLSFPAGMAYAKQWSSNFVKYVIIGPILAFFIWLSLASFGAMDRDILKIGSSSGETLSGTSEIMKDGGKDINVGVGKAGAPSFVATFTIAMAMLIGGLLITQKMGVAGGALAGAAVGKIRGAGMAPIKLGGILVKRGGKVITRKLKERKATAWLTPDFWKAVGRTGERMDKTATERAEGYGDEFWQIIWKGKMGAAPAKEMAERRIQANYEKQFYEDIGNTVNTENMVQGVVRALADKSGERFDRLKGALGAATEQGNYDDVYDHLVKHVFTSDEVAQEWGFKDLEEARVGNDVTYKIATMHMLGLDRNKFDPEKIKEEYLENWDEMIGVDVEGALSEKQLQSLVPVLRLHLPEAVRDGERAATKEEIEEARGKFIEKAEEEGDKGGAINDLRSSMASKFAEDERTKNTKKASKKEMEGLWTMAAMTTKARSIGHWEQSTVLKDANTGLPLLLSNLEKIANVKGETVKMDIGALRKHFAPHNIVSRLYDEKGDIRLDDGGWETMTDYQKAVITEILGPEFSSEAHRGQIRFPRQLLRLNQWIDSDGTFKDENSWDKYIELREKNPKLIDDYYNFMFFGRDKGIAPLREKGTAKETMKEYNKRVNGFGAGKEAEVETEKKKKKIPMYDMEGSESTAHPESESKPEPKKETIKKEEDREGGDKTEEKEEGGSDKETGEQNLSELKGTINSLESVIDRFSDAVEKMPDFKDNFLNLQREISNIKARNIQPGVADSDKINDSRNLVIRMDRMIKTIKDRNKKINQKKGAAVSAGSSGGLTREAENVLKKADSDGIPIGPASKKLKKIVEDNGIETTEKEAAGALIQKLRVKRDSEKEKKEK